MRYFWALVATIGLSICGIGCLFLHDLVGLFASSVPGSWALPLAGIGFCIYGIARVWMLVMWKTGQERHSSPFAN